MANNNDDRVERHTFSMSDLGEFTDDELGEITHLMVHFKKVIPEGGPIPDNEPLSPRIGLCRNMIELDVINFSVLPPEILNCTMITELFFCSDKNDDNCQIDLPDGIILPNLTKVYIQRGGNWNTGEIMSWLATCSSNLIAIFFNSHTKDTANQFLTELQNNEAFINKFNDTLKQIAFDRCNLNEDDAQVIIVDIQQLYPNLGIIYLRNNNIEGLETIAIAVRETSPPANNNLRGLFLQGNPVSCNLDDTNSSDHNAMVCLLKNYDRLLSISDLSDTTMTHSLIIDYWMIMNGSALRYMSDDGHGGTRLSILPYIMNRVYNQREQDPTIIFTILREGPIFRTNYQINVDDNNNDID